MWIVKGIFNTILVVTIFSAGFYSRHWLDPAFEVVETMHETKAKAANLLPW